MFSNFRFPRILFFIVYYYIIIFDIILVALLIYHIKLDLFNDFISIVCKTFKNNFLRRGRIIVRICYLLYFHTSISRVPSCSIKIKVRQFNSLLIHLSAVSTPYSNDTKRGCRELRPTEINTTLAYYAVAFFSAKSICRERR